MASQLQRAYPTCLHTVVISNAAFLDPPNSKSATSRGRDVIGVIGFFGNISEAKGVFDFLRVAGWLESAGWNVTAKLAGPFEDREIERRVREQMRSLRSVEYVGPKYGAEKHAFFEHIDVLLFPTRYRNEAEPVTIYEAMAHGVPVIAYGRGAIGEVLDDECGHVVGASDDFVAAAVQRLRTWSDSAADFQKASHRARARFERIHQQGRRSWNTLRADKCSQDALPSLDGQKERDPQRSSDTN
jgi:glycosyltransferase involved in cell wall biosynthesis